MRLKITNIKTKQSKLIKADNYTIEDVEKTFKVYEARGLFYVKFVR